MSSLVLIVRFLLWHSSKFIINVKRVYKEVFKPELIWAKNSMIFSINYAAFFFPRIKFNV